MPYIEDMLTRMPTQLSSRIDQLLPKILQPDADPRKRVHRFVNVARLLTQAERRKLLEALLHDATATMHRTPMTIDNAKAQA